MKAGVERKTKLRAWAAVATVAVGAWSCAKPEDLGISCAQTNLTQATPAVTQGSAQVFDLDPIISSRDPSLSPGNLKLDDFRHAVPLTGLGGRGVLEGKYVDIRNGACQEWFGAYAADNQFIYEHRDARFQEAMAYFYGDRYRAHLDSTGYLAPAEPVRIVAHCTLDDNAYFARGTDSAGNVVGKVCLGDSVATPGASYADDATVTVHELQHATTMDTYSPTLNFGSFWYDEAGALNEAISDFMSLAQGEPEVTVAGFDPRLFSRWALDRFIPGRRSTRGAHRCPTYDPTFAQGCPNFPAFNGTANGISYVYPDGVGWPYANNYPGATPAKTAFTSYRNQEEIHNAGVTMVGALYDVYDALRNARGGDSGVAFKLATQLVHEAIRHLPKPSLASLSPITFRGFAAEVSAAGSIAGLSSSEQGSVDAALTARGLLGGTPVPANWLAVGDGRSVTPGVRVLDNPSTLRSWFYRIGADATVITQGISTGLNDQLDPGEVAALWFDLRDVSPITAGGVRVTVTSLDPEVKMLGGNYNAGALSASQAQIQYGKVNGTSIVAALGAIPAGNSYFKTNPAFDLSWTTAIFVKVDPAAAHGKSARFSVEAAPSNGAAATVEFTATIR